MKRTSKAIATMIGAALVCALGAGLVACSTGAEKVDYDPTQMAEDTTGGQSADDAAKAEEKAAKAEEKAAKKEAEEEQTSSVEKNMKAAEKAAAEATSGYNDIAYTVVLPDGSLSFNRNGDRKYVSASMIKLLILAEFMVQVDEGDISLDDTYTLKESDIVGGTAHISNEGAGAKFSYDELAKYMICYSDNTATNILIDKLGMDNINARASKLGLEQTDLQRKMMDLDSGMENHMSTNDAAVILADIASHTLASDKMCDKAEGYLKAQTDGEGLIEGLSGVEFGHKTGDLDTNRHDAGIVYSDPPFIIAFFSRDNGRDTANQLMAATSEAVLKAMK